MKKGRKSSRDLREESFRWIRERLGGVPSRMHFTGMGGVGMAGLAFLMHNRGWQVCGCDAEEGDLLEWLEAKGVQALRGHSAEHLSRLNAAAGDCVIRSPALPDGHPELEAARAAGLPVIDRGVALAALLETMHRVVAVCGSHGKTTTASFTAALLHLTGQPVQWCIGGATPNLGAVAGCLPDDGAAPTVVEADESDGTLSLYSPQILVLTGIDDDHLEHFGNIAELEKVFAEVISRTQGVIVYSRDDMRTHALLQGHPQTVGVGLHREADLRAADIRPEDGGTSFTLLRCNRRLGSYRLGPPGLHNLRNALAALGAVEALGGDLAAAAGKLAELSLPARRFELLAEDDGVRYYSDYAHHPAEVAALVETALMQPHQRIVVVFQPHRYSRTLAMGARFPAAFAGVSRLLLTPVHAASETPLAGGTEVDLREHFKQAAGLDPAVPVPEIAESLEAALEWLQAGKRCGDVVLIVGAGTIGKLAQSVAREYNRASGRGNGDFE